MKRIIILSLSLFFIISVQAQNPVPANNESKKILILNGTTHTGAGYVIENSVIGIIGNKIELIGDARTVKVERSKYDTIIYAEGKHIYPGFIALNTIIGLSEIELVRATNDFDETGSINPSVRSLIAYNTDSRVTPTVRSNGVLLAQITPQGGLISGSSSVVQLDAWNYEDAVVVSDNAMHINWPTQRINTAWWAAPAEEQKEKMKKAQTDLQQLLLDAHAYYQAKGKTNLNPHLESMKGLFDGSKKLYVHANYVKDILSAIDVCRNYKIKMVLVGGNDSPLITDVLKKEKIPVILNTTHSLPYRTDTDADFAYKLPSLLNKAGIETAIHVDGFWQVRNLAFAAGNAVPYGINPEEALKMISLTPAKILEIDQRYGSLEEGKSATLFICEGNALDMRTQKIEHAWIDGRSIDLNNIQTQLYHKFMNKYGLKP
ncbi:MAG TPA: amidohydrolase family protein [Bacteroidia bacterium]|nr:amidohydrolase family protein [Bacteroidia bacterium]HNT79431.1 amidohydrolase family protein [Bacteroidia bacterium]